MKIEDTIKEWLALGFSGASIHSGRRTATTHWASKTSSFAIVNKFGAWYRALGFSAASDHSGFMIAIAKWSRKISTVGGSLRHIPLLALH